MEKGHKRTMRRHPAAAGCAAELKHTRQLSLYAFMKHEDFTIGGEFWTATGKWRCTDVGTRTLVAIKLGPREMVRILADGSRTRFIDDSEDLFHGPPYAIAEDVFDENSFAGCHMTKPEARDD